MKRMHLHIGVSDLERSIGFYTALLGAPPSVVKADYAKWMLDDPRVNLAISQGHVATPGIEHVGIQAENADELAGLAAQLKAAAEPVTAEPGAQCCYAASDKNWTRDPDGVIWETFHTMDEIATYGTSPDLSAVPVAASKSGACCG